MKYILKIPIYKVNTGRADNGNIILERLYNDKQEAINDRDFLNSVYNRDKSKDLPKKEYERLQDILDWEGYLIKESYVVQQLETVI